MTKPESKKSEEKVDWVQQIAERIKANPLPLPDDYTGHDHEYLH